MQGIVLKRSYTEIKYLGSIEATRGYRPALRIVVTPRLNISAPLKPGRAIVYFRSADVTPRLNISAPLKRVVIVECVSVLALHRGRESRLH